MAPRLLSKLQIFLFTIVPQFPRDLAKENNTKYRKKLRNPNIEVCPESLRAMLEY